MRRLVALLAGTLLATSAAAQETTAPTISLPVSIANGGTGAATTSQSFAFIGPTSGSGAPSFRALASGDLPSLSGTYCALAGCTLTGAFNNSVAGAASTPQLNYTGSWYTSGSTSTNTPQWYLNCSGATAPTFNTAGQGLGLNACSGFAGNFLDTWVNGSEVFWVTQSGSVHTNGSIIAGSAGFLQFGSNGIISSSVSAGIQFGGVDAASPIAQFPRFQSVATGTSNTAGANATLEGSRGTGNGAGGSVSIQTAGTGAAATTQNTEITALTVAGAVGSTPGVVTVANQLVISGTTTGTNADFLCLTSAQLVVLQSSACTISKRELKKDITPWSPDGGLADVLALKPETFTFKGPNKDPNALRPQRGFIADEVAKVDPKLTIYDDDMRTPKSYRQEAMIAALVGAVQAEQAEIISLKVQIRKLQHAH